ncbi:MULTISPECIES: DUF7518 family protein [Halolamina]|uniref:Chromosome segregation protein SMC n=1 Tax=Halolamina pelagica TaxID=699431 RepID=A0A1I5SYM8_9EURY|nr:MULTISPECIES: hypothetical protein [Halolamina]NHX36908.1 chromosome segregation protein SMC [Halolamina sp. R1-12]SFP75537.1 hypothetical protein SAMN05216277_10764 [Halolamina pelagica]
MSNRADDLESQVAELQAAVDGLTEELVETKERVRQLEETTEDLEADASEPARTGNDDGRTTAEEQAQARGTDERRDAELVANDGVDEEPPAEEVEAEDDSDDDGDDIIVA